MGPCLILYGCRVVLAKPADFTNAYLSPSAVLLMKISVQHFIARIQKPLGYRHEQFRNCCLWVKQTMQEAMAPTDNARGT